LLTYKHRGLENFQFFYSLFCPPSSVLRSPSISSLIWLNKLMASIGVKLFTSIEESFSSTDLCFCTKSVSLFSFFVAREVFGRWPPSDDVGIVLLRARRRRTKQSPNIRQSLLSKNFFKTVYIIVFHLRHNLHRTLMFLNGSYY